MAVALQTVRVPGPGVRDFEVNNLISWKKININTYIFQICIYLFITS